MADLHDESSDSRTAIAGRKRDLHDAMQYREPADGDASSEEDSRKRFKGSHHSFSTSPHLPPKVDVVALSPLQHEQPVSVLSREENSKASQLPAKHTLNPVQGEPSVSLPQAEMGSNVPPATFTWNQGVQSGLRTSFGSRGRPRRVISIPVSEEHAAKQHSASSSAMELNTQMMIGSSDNPLGEALRSPEKNGMALSDGRASLSDNAVPFQPAASLLGTDRHSGRQIPQAPALGFQDYAKRAQTGAVEIPRERRLSDLSVSVDNDTDTDADHNIEVSTSGDLTGSVYTNPESLHLMQKGRLKNSSDPKTQFKTKAPTTHQLTLQLLSPEALEAVRAVSSTKLKEDQLSLLKPHHRNEYIAAVGTGRVEKRRGKIEEVSRQAAEMFENGYDSSSAAHLALVKKIAKGATFFPRELKPEPTYNKGGVQWNLPEILDQGKPIHIEQFSFNVFAPAFLASNRDKWSVISPTVLTGAFGTYINQYYSHWAIKLNTWLPSTTKASDALTLEQAKRIAEMNEQHGNMSLPPPPSKLPSSKVQTQYEGANQRCLEVGSSRRSKTKSNLEIAGDSVLAESVRAMADVQTLTIRDIPKTSEQMPQTLGNIRESPVSIETTQQASTPSRIMSSSREPLPDPGESMDFVIDESESFLQQKYFPSSTATMGPRCLSCGQSGHNRSICPASSCTTCGISSKHSTASCPLNARCGKCRERGHSKEVCPEKLARSDGEAIPCDICGSRNHLETACHYIWRSYDPKLEVIRMVRDIPVHCYNCGGDDHYGPECGLHSGHILSGESTWSRANLSRYLDPGSRQPLLASVDYSISNRAKKQFTIKGKGKADDPIPLDDSDDESFIRPRISHAVQNGHIRFGRSNEENLPRRSYENAPPYSYGLDSMFHDPDMSYRQSSQQLDPYQRSGPRQGPAPGPRGSKNGKGGLNPQKIAEIREHRRKKRSRGQG